VNFYINNKRQGRMHVLARNGAEALMKAAQMLMEAGGYKAEDILGLEVSE
jgi:hypothetical protein